MSPAFVKRVHKKFKEVDHDGSKSMDYDEFVKVRQTGFVAQIS